MSLTIASRPSADARSVRTRLCCDAASAVRPDPRVLVTIGPLAENKVRIVVRDNGRHRADIERLYRIGVRAAKREITIANAYFFPGYRLLRDLRRAARRGVRVNLILQGNPDMRWVQWAANTLHDYLLRGGVHIYEYCERPMHAKVAVIDGDWVTVGSSNLDPLSLFLNLEANVVARSRALADVLRASLARLMQHHCRRIEPEDARRRTLLRQLLSYLAYHATRRLPSFAGWLPAHAPRHATLPAPDALLDGTDPDDHSRRHE